MKTVNGMTSGDSWWMSLTGHKCLERAGKYTEMKSSNFLGDYDDFTNGRTTGIPGSMVSILF